MAYPQTLLTKTIRRGIMCGFIFLFFLVTPLIILYTAGYRYDWKNKQIQQTGVISIDVEPRDVRVLLNNVPAQKRMPLRLANRAPGTYHLSIEKFGYKTWEKDITVTSRQTTYIKNVTLFREQQPLALFADGSMTEAQSLTASADGSYLFTATEQDGIYTMELIHTQTSKKIVLKKAAGNSPPRVLWSPWNNGGLIVTPHGESYTVDLFDPVQEKIIVSQTLIAPEPVFQWDKNGIGIFTEETVDGSRVLVHLDEGGVFQSASLLPGAGAWYMDENDDVWAFYPEDRTIRKNNGVVVFTASFLIEEFIDVNDERIIAKTPANEVTIKLASDQTQYFFTPLQAYNRNTGEWLAWSGSELWSIYPDGNAVLLDRRQEEIKAVLPLDQYGVLLIATPQILYGFNPGYAVTHELARIDALSGIGVSERQKKIYFLGTVDGKKDLYVLSY